MVFVNSMCDLFHARVPLDFVRDVFAVIADTPQHTYQVLTKRSSRLREDRRQAGLAAEPVDGRVGGEQRRRSFASTICGRCRRRSGSCRASRCSARWTASTSTASTG